MPLDSDQLKALLVLAAHSRRQAQRGQGDMLDMVRFASDPVYARIMIGHALADGDRDVARAALRLLAGGVVGKRGRGGSEAGIGQTPDDRTQPDPTRTRSEPPPAES